MNTAFPPVVIQAGGKGERMKARGSTVPKVLTPVKGVPLVERLIRQLAAEGARHFHVIVGSAGEQVEAHVEGLRDLPTGVELSIVRETQARGNVGALSEVAASGTPLLFVFGDLYTTLEFRRLLDVHRDRACALTAASHFEHHRLQLGHLITEADRIVDYREKPEYRFLICSGIMVIEPEVLRLIPKSGMVGMNRLVMMAIEAGLEVTHWEHGAAWMDVNTPELLETANATDW